jgi:hypothetical protein
VPFTIFVDGFTFLSEQFSGEGCSGVLDSKESRASLILAECHCRVAHPIAHFAKELALSVVEGVGLRQDHRSPINSIVLHRQQRLIGLIECKRRHLRTQSDFIGNAKEIAGIVPRHVGHAAKLAFAP